MYIKDTRVCVCGSAGWKYCILASEYYACLSLSNCCTERDALKSYLYQYLYFFVWCVTSIKLLDFLTFKFIPIIWTYQLNNRRVVESDVIVSKMAYK